ncbi:hypothetical protein ZEAMMB73_Zm00001d032085 [Zea mays]|uniref:Uncharacterized protein n=1 Tax=Zea mays TaxID=4577 RepID=A0A1D6KNF1_MAIZE|nr:hypothetical protein ZEAMMB73_Zm00001d032085 [Zea mays]ONM04349.1 hypothetical protein ZEAMMB73_Zm00001d032085 [Zea mays]
MICRFMRLSSFHFNANPAGQHHVTKQVFKQIYKTANLLDDFIGSKVLLVVYWSLHFSFFNLVQLQVFSTLYNFDGHLTLKEDVILFEVCAILIVQSKNIVVHVSKGINFI